MSHFHLKHCARSGTATINFDSLFYSELEALDAAALANATRGQEPGYYGVQLCRRQTCQIGQEQPPVPAVNFHPATPRIRVAPRPRVLN